MTGSSIQAGKGNIHLYSQMQSSRKTVVSRLGRLGDTHAMPLDLKVKYIEHRGNFKVILNPNCCKKGKSGVNTETVTFLCSLILWVFPNGSGH